MRFDGFCASFRSSLTVFAAQASGHLFLMANHNHCSGRASRAQQLPGLLPVILLATALSSACAETVVIRDGAEFVTTLRSSQAWLAGTTMQLPEHLSLKELPYQQSTSTITAGELFIEGVGVDRWGTTTAVHACRHAMFRFMPRKPDCGLAHSHCFTGPLLT